MNLPDILNIEQGLLREEYINQLLQVNEVIQKHGLRLTRNDANQIINVRNKALKGYGRIDLSFEVTRKLIEALSASAFLNEKNYVRIINEMQESFYFLKNETEDRIGDNRLIEIMTGLFENSCEGSVELMNSCLEEFSRDFRKGLE